MRIDILAIALVLIAVCSFGEAIQTILTKGGLPCVFPFIYEDKTYVNSCVKGNQEWCYTDALKNWDYCQPYEKRIETVTGKHCLASFEYKGKTYNNECALGMSGYWCYIDADLNYDDCIVLNNVKVEPYLYATYDEEKTPIPTSCNRTATKFTRAQQQQIVDYHNQVREEAGASFMMKMRWSDYLAQRAQYYTDLCPEDHAETFDCNGIHVGQNLVVHYALNDWQDVDLKVDIVESWGKNEKVYYDETTQKCQPGRVCGHYTQTTGSDSYQVGCGITKCKKEGANWPFLTVFACDYFFSGNQNQLPPYAKGPACSECANKLYPFDYKCIDGKYCEPCRTGEKGCQKQDLCRDVDTPKQCNLMKGICLPKTRILAQEFFLTLAMNKCRKSCDICDIPDGRRNHM